MRPALCSHHTQPVDKILVLCWSQQLSSQMPVPPPPQRPFRFPAEWQQQQQQQQHEQQQQQQAQAQLQVPTPQQSQQQAPIQLLHPSRQLPGKTPQPPPRRMPTRAVSSLLCFMPACQFDKKLCQAIAGLAERQSLPFYCSRYWLLCYAQILSHLRCRLSMRNFSIIAVAHGYIS